MLLPQTIDLLGLTSFLITSTAPRPTRTGPTLEKHFLFLLILNFTGEFRVPTEGRRGENVMFFAYPCSLTPAGGGMSGIY